MKLELLRKIATTSQVYIVDVGHHKGHFIESFSKELALPREKLYIVGVDAINYNTNIYDRFYEGAVTNRDENFLTFNLYDEPGCNSLLTLKTEKLVRDRNQDGWFCNHEIKKIGEKTVPCCPLKVILEDSGWFKGIIHYLKVDAQGNDLDVIKSLREYLGSCLFIQMESCVSNKLDNTMYEGQNLFDSDRAFMEANGFEVLTFTDHSQVSCPEADVVFVNKKLFASLSA